MKGTINKTFEFVNNVLGLMKWSVIALIMLEATALYFLGNNLSLEYYQSLLSSDTVTASITEVGDCVLVGTTEVCPR